MNRTLKFILICAVFATSSTAQALSWGDLSAPQRDVLARYADTWEGLPEARQERLALGAQRWLAMDSVQRNTMSVRFERWQELSPERRRQLLDRLAKFIEVCDVEFFPHCGDTFWAYAWDFE